MSTRDAPICAIRDEICALLAHGVSTIIRVSHAIALAPTMRENTAISTVSMTEREQVSLSVCVCMRSWRRQRHFVLIINYVCLLAVSHGFN